MGKKPEPFNKTWCDGWITGFMAAMVFMTKRKSAYREWCLLRDEYLARKQQDQRNG